jgi:hypothetical protein
MIIGGPRSHRMTGESRFVRAFVAIEIAAASMKIAIVMFFKRLFQPPV